jgi:drug/metabolite transporter (DMT)-like permease
MRAIVTTIMIVVGVGIMILSYTVLATPVCNDSIACSNPNVAFATGIFVLGIVIAFSSAIFYAVYKG